MQRESGGDCKRRERHGIEKRDHERIGMERGDVHPRLLPPSPFNRMAATVSPRTSQKCLRNPLGEFVPANLSSRENLMTRSTARQRFGHETLSNKNSRYALQATGALLIAASGLYFVLPSHGGSVGASLLIAGLLLAWTQS